MKLLHIYTFWCPNVIFFYGDLEISRNSKEILGFKITPLYSFAPTIFIIFIDRRFIKQKDRGESLEGEEATQVTKDRVEGYKREQNTGSNP